MFIFWDSNIITVPTYYETDMHKHAMVHVIVSEEPIAVVSQDIKAKGKLVLIGQDVPHKVSITTKNTLLLFIDPSTAIADNIKDKYLMDTPFCTFNKDYRLDVADKNEDEIIAIATKMLNNLGVYHTNNKVMDKRINDVLDMINNKDYLLKTINEIAKDVSLSSSRLSHLFKQETNMRLKNCLLMHKLKFVYTQVQQGKSITEAAMDMGFSDSAHLSKAAKSLTGIPITTYFLKDS